MKKTLLSFSLFLSLVPLSQTALSAPYCSKPLYLGFELGGGNLHYDRSELGKSVTTVRDTGFAGRLLAGFDVNRNIGFEMGYLLYRRPEFTNNSTTLRFTQESLDFLGKISVPVSPAVSFFAKGGMAYVHTGDGEIETRNHVIKIIKEDEFVRPMLGIGVGYGFNSKVAGTLGYYRTFGAKNLQDADFFSAGINIRIG